MSRTSTIIAVDQKRPRARSPGPIEAEWTPTFNDQLQAVREILDGNPAPDWMDQKIFVALSKSPWP